MTRKGKGKKKRQKAGLNRSLLDVAIGMTKDAIKYKLIEAGGVYLEAPTQKLKPTQLGLPSGPMGLKAPKGKPVWPMLGNHQENWVNFPGVRAWKAFRACRPKGQ